MFSKNTSIKNTSIKNTSIKNTSIKNTSIKNIFSNNILFNIIIIGLGIIIVIFFIYSSYKSYTNYQKYNPYLIDGITDATIAQKFSSHKINPSTDSSYGTEFTYSFWIFIKDTNFNNKITSGTCTNGSGGDSSQLPLLHVFHKGSYNYIANDGSSSKNNSTYYPLLQMPGVWLYPNTNKLNICFNTYENPYESADIGNIPLNMWVNIIIVLIGNSVDIYINGNLKKRLKLNGVPKINYDDLYSTNWGGFAGYLSKLQYFNKAIDPFMIDQIFNNGPSQTFATNIIQGITDPSAVLSPNYWMTTGYPNSNGSLIVEKKSSKEKINNSYVIVNNSIDAFIAQPAFKLPQITNGNNHSFSIWINIKDWNYKFKEYKNILWKGNPQTTANSATLNTSNIHCPSIWLYPLSKSLKVLTSTSSPELVESCDIKDIPLMEWVHIVYVLNNRSVNIYINGKLENSCELKGIPIITNDPVYITSGSPLAGFYGKISNIQYFTDALLQNEVNNIYQKGELGNT
jgi:hypothetical protein